MHKLKNLRWLLLILTFSVGVHAANSKFIISEFGQKSLDGWEEKSFAGKTLYEFQKDGDSTVLVATASSTASGLGKKIKVDLTKTPFINWSWKINNKLEGLDEKTKSGDDYVARLYVVKSGGAFIWKTKALNYVWSSNQKRDVFWPNAFQPKNAIMLSVRGAEDQAGQWITEKRNVLEDLKQAFGKNIKSIDAVAIMTDTDNSKGEASAAYGEIYFTAE